MPVNPADGPILGTLYGSDAMRAVFDETAYFQRMLDVEAALARVQARRHFVVAEHLAVVQQGDRAGFGGGIQGQQSGHRGIRSGRQRAAL